MKVVYDFNATQKGQMTVKKGDILDVVPASDKSHAGWIKVIKNGNKGYIPHNYTKVHAAAAKVALKRRIDMVVLLDGSLVAED